jgi:signal transduction histidine kinase/CheY-like chemotaxis protein
MIKGRLIKNQGYGFITVIFLVLALSCLSILAFINQRDTDKLAKAVGDLSETRSSIDRVDEAIRLLYAAENNCRLYILQKDSVFALAYQHQLQQVSVILDSLTRSDGKFADSAHMETLIADKAQRTKQYIQARLLLDSLLQLSDNQVNHPQKEENETFAFKNRQPASMDTTMVKSVLPAVPKRKLLTRLRDAITNKQYKRINQTVIIQKRSLDSVYQIRKQDLKGQSNALMAQAAMFMALKSKERALLSANHNLLQGLQKILASLKATILEQQQQRKALLSKNAFSIANDIRFGNTLLIVFGLLLTLIIIWILQRLFKNSNQLKSAKEKAEEYARLKSEFAETMSHEIRTPLHSITRFANELSTDHKSGEQSEVIDAIKLSSGMLLSVVNNILDYTKMEKGKFKLAEIPFNPLLVIREILSGLRLQAKRKNLQLEQCLDSALNTTLIGDAFQLRQLLINLLSNAIKYTDSGSIRIAASLHKKNAETCIMALAIKDTGIGIDGQIESKMGGSVFDAYVTAVHRREIKEGSTGLGLSIVKKVIELHKGKIDVESVVGKGTTFYIELPYKWDGSTKKQLQTKAVLGSVNVEDGTSQVVNKEMETPKTEQLLHKNQDPIATKTELKVLVVDNDLLNRTYLAMLLKRGGFLVTEADGGRAALEKCAKQVFDLIITDISMPDMDGYELANLVRSHNSANRQVPIMGVSGQQPQIRGNGSPSVENFNGWLLKPFEPKELFDLVNDLIVHMPSN